MRYVGARASIATRALASLAALAALLVASRARGGPPYVTDNPEPVPYRHWELYLASQGSHDRDGWSGTGPHVEVNYGPVPNLQLHLITPLAYAAPDGAPSTYGYGDTELGFKLRFVQERKWLPMIGIFPLLEVPTGSVADGLGNGSTQVFVPVWLQKSFGKWQTYGGVGVWIDLGDRDRHWWLFGWQVQRQITSWLTLGAEVFHQTPDHPGGEGDTRFDIGGQIDFSDVHHLLFSAGRGFGGPNLFQYYVAYQATFGPREVPRP